MDMSVELSVGQVSAFHATLKAMSKNNSSNTSENATSILKLSEGLSSNILPSVTDQLSTLEDDPRLSKEYVAIIALIKANADPDAVDGIIEKMHESMKSMTLNGPIQGNSNFSGNSQLNVRMSEFVAQISSRRSANGEEVETNTTVSITETEITATADTGQRPKEDPLTLDLNGNGKFDLSKRTNFDLNVDGKKENIAFVSNGDGFLALDKNGNGIIDNGSELFGDQNGMDNGFDELARYDENKDNVIDGKDSVYSNLKVLGDFNDDGKSELKCLKGLGIESISLSYQNTRQKLASDVTLSQIGSYRRDGVDNLAGVLLLAYA